MAIRMRWPCFMPCGSGVDSANFCKVAAGVAVVLFHLLRCFFFFLFFFARFIFFDFAAKLRMRMQQTAFLLWPFAIVPPMCCQFGGQPWQLLPVHMRGFIAPFQLRLQ